MDVPGPLCGLTSSAMICCNVQGQYRVELAAHGDDGDPLLCLVVDFSIGPPSLASVLRGDR